ncbi:Hsp70 family protein [Krasilnikovia sp. MM14-A1004]|uniref:Hsp70 family protein n=1 Tax=Krasilnikovia sp. MM14-A1004 TaxID=3373541 RepID=UPI00399C5816
MGYGLGVDLGTTHTAAAVDVDGHVEPVHLGSRRPEIPSVVYLRDDGEILVGEAAQRRGDADPARLAREFKRRLGDPVPVLLGGAPFSAHALTARLLAHVVDTVSRSQEAPPERIVVTHPANWGPYKRELLAQAAQLADVGAVTLRPEPAAAAVRFAATARVAPGEIVAVYDLGGGTFDAAVLHKTGDGFALLGEPEGIEQLGGIDFDEAILEHVRDTLGGALDSLDLADDHVTEALVRLRRDCVEAKENLSYDTEAVLGVALPQLHTRVRINRAEFEAMIGPALGDTVAAMRRALRAAGVRPEQLRCIVLAGGSARIPLVTELLTEQFQRPLGLDEQPELGIALGAARLSRPGHEPARLNGASVQEPDAGPARAAPATPPSSPATTATPPSPTAAASPPPPIAAATPPPPTAAATPPPPTAAASPPPPIAAATPPPPTAAATPLPPGAAALAGAGGSATAVLDRSGVTDVAHAPDDHGTTADRRRTPLRRKLGAAPRSLRRAYRWGLVGGVVATVLGAAAVAAWPRGADSASSSGGAAAGGSAAAGVLWQRATGSAVTGPPAVTAQRIVLGGTDGVIRAFRRADGSPAWAYRAHARVAVAARIVGDTVLASTSDGEIVALDAASGARRWQRSTGTTIDAAPTIAGDHVYAAGRDGVLYRYELAAGQHRTRAWTGGEIRTAAVVRGAVAVVAATDGRWYGAEPGGTPRWRTRVGPVAGTPQLAGDTACAPLTDGAVRCVRVSDGVASRRIALPGAGLLGLAGGDGVVFAAGTDGSVVAWDVHTGAARWWLPPSTRSPSASPAAGPASAFPATRAGELDLAYPDGRLRGVDAGTGAPRWELRVDDSFDNAPSGDAAGLFATGTTGTLYAIGPPHAAGSPTGPSSGAGVPAAPAGTAGTSAGQATSAGQGEAPGPAGATGPGTRPGSAGSSRDPAAPRRTAGPPEPTGDSGSGTGSSTGTGAGQPPTDPPAEPGPTGGTTPDPDPATAEPTWKPDLDLDLPTLPTPRHPFGGLVPPNLVRPRLPG